MTQPHPWAPDRCASCGEDPPAPGNPSGVCAACQDAINEHHQALGEQLQAAGLAIHLDDLPDDVKPDPDELGSMAIDTRLRIRNSDHVIVDATVADLLLAAEFAHNLTGRPHDLLGSFGTLTVELLRQGGA